MEIKLLETEVEDYIFEGQLLETYGIKCIDRQVRFGVAGIVDILGYDRLRKCWVIVEIKRDGLDAKAYAQGMRYRNWLSNLLLEKHTARGGEVDLCNLPYVLLIGSGLSEDLRFLSEASPAKFLGDACYLKFNIEPRVTLGGCATSCNYRWDMFKDIGGRVS